MRSRPSRSRSFATNLLLLVILACAVAGGAQAFAHPTTACKSFQANSYTYEVTRNSSTTCKTARAVMREFFTGNPKKRGGPASYQTYYTLPKHKGWRCGTGAGDAPYGTAVCSRRSDGGAAGAGAYD